MSAVLALPAGLLSTNQRFVLLMYANHANRYGERSYPARWTIADETGLSESSVSRATRDLVKMGLLEMIARPGRDPKTQRFTGSFVYDLRLPNLESGPDDELPMMVDDGFPEDAVGHADTRRLEPVDNSPSGPVDNPGAVSQAVSQAVWLCDPESLRERENVQSALFDEPVDKSAGSSLEDDRPLAFWEV